MTDRRKLLRLVRQMEEGAAAAREAARLPGFGTADCEPFWQAADLLDLCTVRIERAAEQASPRRKPAP